MTNKIKSIFNRKRVLITGGAGFIGSHLTDRVVALGGKVCVIDNLSSGNIKNIRKHIDSGSIEFYDIDIEGSHTESLFEQFKPTDVFHLAAIPGVTYSVKHPVETHYTNVIGTLNLLEQCVEHRVKRLVYSSSSSVYGGSAAFPTAETSALDPKSPYALQKMTSEVYCKMFAAKERGLDTVSLRYFNVFGPRQSGTSSYAAVIAAFCEALKNKDRPKIYGDGEQFRDFCYVENVVRANLRACIYKKPLNGEVFNVACGEKMTVNQLAKKMGLRSPIYMPERLGDVKGSLADISKVSKVLKYKPIINAEDGLKRVISWYLSQ